MTRLITAVSIAALVTSAAWATAPAHISTDRNGVALSGYDPVAYFEAGSPQEGNDRITTRHDGAVYRFASEANRDAFTADPDRFLPQYGGFCAYGMTLGKKFDTDPEAWKIVDGKLYLNKNQSIRKTWIQDVPGNIAKADTRWPDVKFN